MVNLVFTPGSVARGMIVNGEDVCEILKSEAGGGDSQLVVQLPNGSSEMTSTNAHLPFDTVVILRISLSVHIQRVTATCIRPVQRKRNLLTRPTLQQQSSLHIEKKNAESAMTQR